MAIHRWTRMITVPALLLASTALGAAPRGSAPSAVDVALGAGGVMRGRLVDPSGIALAGQSVSVFYEGRVIAQSVTDDQGDFSVAGLRGGSHALTTGGNSLICRLWTGNAAPPVAQTSVLMVSPSRAVRGQSCQGCNGCNRCKRGRHGPYYRETPPYFFGDCKPPSPGIGHYLLQPRALILYAGLGAVIWQASDSDLASPSL